MPFYVNTSVTGNQDAFDPVGADLWRVNYYRTGLIVRCNNAAVLTLRGMLAPTDYIPTAADVANNWPVYYIVALGAGGITFANEHGTPSTFRRFVTQGANLSVSQGAVVTVAYDDAALRWRIVARATSG